MGTQTDSDMSEMKETPDISPHTYGLLIYDKVGKNIQGWKDSLFNNGVGKFEQLYAKEDEIKTFSSII